MPAWPEQRNRPHPDDQGGGGPPGWRVLRPPEWAQPPPLRGATRLPLRGSDDRSGRRQSRLLGGHPALGGARLPGRQDRFFLNPRPGPTRAPAKNAARDRIIELRRAGHSATEIAEALAGTPTPLNRTGVAEVLAEAGLGRLPVRPSAERGAPYRDHPRRAQLLDFTDLPTRAETRVAGLLLAVPELIDLDLPAVVAAGYPAPPSSPPSTTCCRC